MKFALCIGLLTFSGALVFAGCSSDTTPASDGGVNVDGSTPDSSTRDSSTGDSSTGDSSTGDSSTADAAVGTTFKAMLTGSQENPAIVSTATGTATLVLSADRTQVTYTITHTATGGTAAHVHKGAGGENGPVVHPLTPFSASMTGTLPVTAAEATDLEQGLWYVNVHTPANADGEIRGQILPPGSTLWVTKLSGAQENPPVVSAATATAAVILDQAKTSVRYHVTSSIVPTAAHIHKGIGTVNGAVLITFPTPGLAIDGTSAIAAADATDLQEGRLYVNLHTTLNANGELRGQLVKSGEVLYLGRMSGLEEVPPLTTTATGASQFILDPTTGMLRYEAIFTNLTATASHLHEGALGTNGAVAFPLTLAGTGAKGSLTLTPANVTTLNAAGYYINAHTALNPNGEARWQVVRP